MLTKLIQITKTPNYDIVEDITADIADLLGEGWVVQQIAGGMAAATPGILGEVYTTPHFRLVWLVLLTKEEE